jgi:hypothetical protein
MSAVILPFTRHARAPSSSKESSENLPFEARTIGHRHLCGTDFRSRHFSTVLDFTPKDAAISPTKSQSNVVLMRPEYSDYLSDCQGAHLRQFGGRPNPLNSLDLVMGTSAKRTEGIQRRIKAAMLSHRTAKGWPAKRLAEVLGVSEDSYEKYESTTPDPKTGKVRKVPDHVIAEFCDITDTDVAWIMLGRKPPQIRKTG